MVINIKGLQGYINDSGEEPKNDVLDQFDKKIFRPLYNIVENFEPSLWGKLLIGQIRKIRNNQNLDPMIQKYLDNYLPIIWDSFRIPVSESIPRTTIYIIQKISRILKASEMDPMDLRLIPLEDICSKVPNTQIYSEGKIKYLIIKNLFGENISIPLVNGVYHKGGVARLLLKLYFDSPWTKSEIPIKDWDILTRDLRLAREFMTVTREKDLSGIEIFETSFEHIMFSRDVDMNQCFLGLNGLWYCPAAEMAVKTGVIFPCSGDHGIYGCDFFVYQGHRFIKGRVFERLIKFVIEGKARGFQVKRESLQTLMGVSAIIGALRKIDSPDYCQRLEKYYYMLKQLGQIEMYQYIFAQKLGLPCDNIFDFLEGLHTLYPYVLFTRLGEDRGVAIWLVEKLIKWLKRDFKLEHHLSCEDFSWIEIDPEEELAEFSLDGFQSDPVTVMALQQWLPDFIGRCDKRNENYKIDDNER